MTSQQRQAAPRWPRYGLLAPPCSKRADEAQQLGHQGRAWPPTVTAHPHWADDYKRAAASAGITLTLDEAVAEVNDWIAQLDTA